MSIHGTCYQDYHWKEIKSLIGRAAVDCCCDPEREGGCLSLRQRGESPAQALSLLYLCIAEALGSHYRPAELADEAGIGAKIASGRDDGDMLSRAIELVVCWFRPEEERLYKRFESLLATAGLEMGAADCRSAVRKNMDEFLSELRYIADAANLTAHTGTRVTPQRMHVLALIQELNRWLERVFAERDLERLSLLLEHPVDELRQQPLIARRAATEAQRPEMILRADRVYHQLHGEEAKLPTKKYNQTRNPEIVRGYLEQLAGLQNPLDQGDDLEWLGDLERVIHEGAEGGEIDIDTIADPLSDSPSMEAAWDPPERKEPPPARGRARMLDCFRHLSPFERLGLFLMNGMQYDLEPEDYEVIGGDKLTWARLAKGAGVSTPTIKKRCQEREAEIRECITRVAAGSPEPEIDEEE